MEAQKKIKGERKEDGHLYVAVEKFVWKATKKGADYLQEDLSEFNH